VTYALVTDRLEQREQLFEFAHGDALFGQQCHQRQRALWDNRNIGEISRHVPQRHLQRTLHGSSGDLRQEIEQLIDEIGVGENGLIDVVFGHQANHVVVQRRLLLFGQIGREREQEQSYGAVLDQTARRIIVEILAVRHLN
jgi:hypothetical protein